MKNKVNGVRKKGAVYGVIAAMLGLAVYLNWSYVEMPDELVVANQASGRMEEVQISDRSGRAHV